MEPAFPVSDWTFLPWNSGASLALEFIGKPFKFVHREATFLIMARNAWPEVTLETGCSQFLSL